MVFYKHTNPATPPANNHYFSGPLGKYHDAQSLNRMVQALMLAHPNLVETIDLPNLTFGYDGAATVCSDGVAVDKSRIQMKLYRLHGLRDCAEHGIFIYGSPHSREWVPKHALLETIYRLLENYGSDTYITDLLDQVDIFYIPDACPDGSMYSFHDVNNFRKNRHIKGGAPETFPYDPADDNSCRVDVNRNYSVGFGYGSSSGNCSNEAYRGIGNHSEPESRNISWVIKQFPKIWVSIVCHSAGDTIFWPVAPDGTIPQLDSANAKSPCLDEILGGTTSQRSGWFNYMAQRARAAVYDHRNTILEQDKMTPGPTPTFPFGSGISTYEMYFNHTDNPHTDRDKTVRNEQWYEHPHKVYQYTFELSSVGQRPPWNEADELIMEWANGILEVAACTRDMSREKMFGLTPIACENWVSGDFTNKSRSRGWESDWQVSGDVEMLTERLVHNGSHSVRLMAKGRIERSLNLSGHMAAKLKFAWRAASWESGDRVYVKVNDGSGWNIVRTFENGDDDLFYHQQEIDLSDFDHLTGFRIAFEGDMSSTVDWFYLDDIRIEAWDCIALDDFKSGDFSGGKGWVDQWTLTPEVTIDNQYPLEGNNCAYIVSNGRMERTVDISDVLAPKLLFDSRSVYFETGDNAFVKVDDGNGEQVVAQITPEHCDKVYHQHVIDLSSFNRIANFKIIFEGAMSSNKDHWYIDRVRVDGVRGIAADNFDSQSFDGGAGFANNWQIQGATITYSEQFSGLGAAQLGNVSRMERSLDLSQQANTRLEFVAKLDDSFADSDEFRVMVDDGSGWQTAVTLNSANADGYYHRVEIDLSDFAHVNNFKIGFECEVISGSFVYVDKVVII